MITTAIEITGLKGRRVSLTPEQFDDLKSRVEGLVLYLGDEGWDAAMRVWNGMVARVPALVLQPISAYDVATAVRFARDHRLLLSIKGGGHNIAGTSIAEGGLTLGGGLGYRARRFGWTVDNLEEVEVVTADGAVCIANRDERAALFRVNHNISP